MQSGNTGGGKFIYLFPFLGNCSFFALLRVSVWLIIGQLNMLLFFSPEHSQYRELQPQESTFTENYCQYIGIPFNRQELRSA